MAEDIPANNSLDVLDNGVIKLTQVGHQTLQSVSQFQTTIDSMVADLHKQGKKALILVDMQGVTGQDPDALVEGRKRIDGTFDALAISARSTTLRMIVNWLVHATGREDQIRFFGDNDTATAWLLGHLDIT